MSSEAFARPPAQVSADGAALVSASGLGKMYHLYDRPQDRLKQAFLWRRRQLYREFWALQDVSFELHRGEALAVIGRNGSGKSTLLQLLAGTLAPTVGQVRVTGRIAALLELGSGFNPEFTGRENVFLNGAIHGLRRADMEARFDAIAAFADIGDFMHQPIKVYSSGMLVRLAFAVQACIEPDILLIDEALSVGDVFFQQKCTERIRKLLRNGTAILFVSHDLSAVANLCDRAMLLAHGRLVASGPPKRVLEQFTAMPFDEGSASASDVPHDHVPAAEPAGVPLQPIPQGVFRYGDGAMRITGFALQSRDGLPLAECTSGDVIRLTLDVVCRESGATPNIGFQIKDRFGNIACGTNTWMLGQDMVPQEMGATVRTTFEISLMLGPGEYSISAAVASPGEHPDRISDWIDGLAGFAVLSPAHQMVGGFAFCPLKVNSSGARRARDVTA